jgi:hypothetical protein
MNDVKKNLPTSKKRKYIRAHPRLKSFNVPYYDFTDDEWSELSSYYKFDITKHGTTGHARQFLTSNFTQYCRVAILAATETTVRQLLKKAVVGLEKLQPLIDELRDLNNRKQGFDTFPLFGDGPSAFNLFSERFDEYQTFVELVKGCSNELPKGKTGPQDETLLVTITEIDKTLQHLSIDADISKEDPRWVKPKNNLKFVGAFFKMAKKRTGINIDDGRINNVVTEYIANKKKTSIVSG